MTALDEYLSAPTASGSLTPEYIDANSGHRLLCPQCKTFKRALIEFVDGPRLRVACKTCKTAQEFLVLEQGFVPEWLVGRIVRFSRTRVREELLGEKNAD